MMIKKRPKIKMPVKTPKELLEPIAAMDGYKEFAGLVEKGNERLLEPDERTRLSQLFILILDLIEQAGAEYRGRFPDQDQEKAGEDFNLVLKQMMPDYLNILLGVLAHVKLATKGGEKMAEPSDDRWTGGDQIFRRPP